MALGSSKGKAASPTIRKRTGGAAVARPRVQSPRSVISEPGRRRSAGRELAIDDQRRLGAAARPQVASLEQDPRAPAALRVRAQEEDVVLAAVRAGDDRVSQAQGHDLVHVGQGTDGGGGLLRVGDARTGEGGRVRRHHAHVEAGGIQQRAEGDEEAAREEEHVEEQRAHGGHAEDAEDRAAGLAEEAAQRERPHLRAHRRARAMAPRRSRLQEAATLARMPRGTATETARAAMAGVTRTKTSAVS